MKEQIKKLNEERTLLINRVNKIDNAIKAFQEVCNHLDENDKSTMIFNGMTAEFSYYKCSICGYEIKELNGNSKI